MKTSIDHLPGWKQNELERVLRIIFEEFEDALALGTNDWKKRAKILKVILFGSHARGDWVYEPHTKVGKHSDYDILIIVNDERLTDWETYWANLSKRLRLEYLVTHKLLAPVQFFVHSLDQVNDMLIHGRYFFMDIAREGIALYQADDTELADPQPKTPQQALEMAREYYDNWISSAGEYYDDFFSNLNRGRFKKSAFELHQCVERLYHGFMLVRTFYTPYSHDIVKLRGQAEQIDPRLAEAWPRERREDVDAYEKLQEAYVKARYIKDFHVDRAQLEWLGPHAQTLTRLVDTSCKERLAELEQAART
ncbi:MAG TPA: HEPN domain-containing protein [Sphingomonas sp.]|nr:HEPN domain-containing protein [Sphingomonas sp.]